MRLSDLQNKSIINLVDGKNIGNIVDVDMSEDGRPIELVVEKRRFLISYFTKKEMLVKWNQIEKIGEDVILVRVVY